MYNSGVLSTFTICTTTTVAPVGVLYKSDSKSPVTDPTTEITAEQKPEKSSFRALNDGGIDFFAAFA